MNKEWLGMQCASSMTIHTLCHCEEGTQVTDAAIHRVLGEADDLSLRLLVTVDRHGLTALAMTRGDEGKVCDKRRLRPRDDK